ncbi:hypothetical protein ACIBK9_01090 [Nonomuraea sp. NPDC050227]|uniref:hypothetical protein n=1 Tax=Nonomuraea sp. NPDC050227 TaxID=3364360 RepID=UPI0037BA8882
MNRRHIIWNVAALPDPLPVFFDCGCPDIYYCPRVGEVECPRHGGFAACCDALEQHIPVRAAISHQEAQ